MKIAAPKLAPAPQTPKSGNTGIVPPAQTAKSGNTGIVPPAQTAKSGNTGIVPPAAESKPADSFQPATSAGTGAATGTSSIAIPKTQSVTTYALPAHLEAHRATFDKYGEHIAKLPSQVQPKAIDHAADSIFKDLGDIATLDEIRKGVTEAVAFYSRRTTTEEPMSYVMATEPSATEPAPGGGQPAQDSGAPGTRGPASRDVSDFFRDFRQQAQQEPQTEELTQRFRRMRRFGF
jgi:hypothetical protein